MDLINVTKEKKKKASPHKRPDYFSAKYQIDAISSEERHSFYWMQTPKAVKWHTTDIFDHYHHITTWTGKMKNITIFIADAMKID